MINASLFDLVTIGAFQSLESMVRSMESVVSESVVVKGTVLCKEFVTVAVPLST